MNFGLTGKTAFVAGSSSGIGRAIAEALAAEGCHLMLAARRGDILAAIKTELRNAYSVNVDFVAGDLDAPADIARIHRTTAELFGTVDILITNNGGPQPGSFRQLDEEQWSHAWNRTLMSAVRLIRLFLPGMQEAGWGRIINVTSIAVKQPVQRLLLSNSYRAAVTGMARTLADEVAPQGITVNNIAPGYIGTERLDQLFEDRATSSGGTADEERMVVVSHIPAGRIGKPAEIAALACFLASQQASYITGTTIQVDGGLYRGLM